MGFPRSFLGIVLLIPVSLVMSQEPRCNPCTDGPEMFPKVRRVFETGLEDLSPIRVAELIAQNGGALSDMAHDCGISGNTSYGQIGFAVRACNWGGRYPALLFEPISTDDVDPVIVLASNGTELAVLADVAAPTSAIEDLSGLSIEDFDEMFVGLRNSTDL